MARLTILHQGLRDEVRRQILREAVDRFNHELMDDEERQYRHINRTYESPFGGNFYGTYEPTAGGTRVTWGWEVEPQNTLVGLLLPVMRPLLAWSLQRDLDTLAKKLSHK